MPDPSTPSCSRLTRRSTLARLGAGGLGAALAARSLAAAAQGATPPAAADLPPGLQEYVAAWEALDADGIAAAYAEDAVAETVPTGTRLEGRDAIRASLSGLFAVFEDLSVEVVSVFATGSCAAAEWQFTGHYTGQLPGFPPGAGQPVTVCGAEILELADGQIQSEREYYDVYGILVQLGVVPPAGAGTPVASPPA